MLQLTPRLLAILEGRTEHPEAVRQSYLAVCVKAGYDVSGVNDLPPTHKLLLNYAKAKAKQVLGYKLTEEAAGARLSICQQNTCGLFRILKGHPRCAEASCGCYLTDKVKDSTATCPKGLW